MTLLLVAAGLTILISSFCSLIESILYSTRMGALEAEREDGPNAGLAERLIGMKSDIARPTSAILILNTIANTAGAAVCGMYATQVLGSAWVPAISAVLTVAILFLGEILPKTCGVTRWPTLWRFVVLPLAVMQKVLFPVIWVTRGFANFFTGTHAAPAVTEDEIQASIRLGRQSGQLSGTEHKLLNAVFQFDDMSARQVLVPRRDVVFLDASWSLGKCLEVTRETGHTRFPLCDGSLDRAVGLIHIKDLVGIPDSDDFDLMSIARPLQHIPETLPISQLLRDMQRSHQQMVLVDDEYGSVVGVVTMENVLEQIVGSVQDEFDSEPPDVVGEGPRTYLVNGQMPIEGVNRECGLNLYSDDVETLSGLLVSRLNRLLREGDNVVLQGATAEVVEAQDGRANRIRLRLDREDGRAS